MFRVKKLFYVTKVVLHGGHPQLLDVTTTFWKVVPWERTTTFEDGPPGDHHLYKWFTGRHFSNPIKPPWKPSTLSLPSFDCSTDVDEVDEEPLDEDAINTWNSNSWAAAPASS